VSINSEAEGDIKAARKVRLPWWALVLIGVLSLPIFWLFDHFGSLGISLPVLDSIIALGFALYVKRRLTRHWWFWMTMAVIAALHALLIWSLPWTEGWKPAVVAGVLISADICLILWIVAAVESVFARRAAAH
jgi:magnesium-transporting ATPase (P-type)